MSPMSRRPVATALIGFTMVAALVASIAFIAARPAGAHASVSSTEPRADSRITALPDRVVIHVLKKAATRAGDPIQVLDPDGVRIDAGDPVISDLGATISVSLRSGSHPSGTYNVYYKITSADTHIIHDRFSFSLAPLSNETAPAPAAGGAVRSDAPVPRAATGAPRLRVVGPPGGSYLGVALVGLAIVTLLVVAVRRRRHRDDAGEPGFRVVTTGEHRLGPVPGALPPQRPGPLTSAPSVALQPNDWTDPPSGQWTAPPSGEWTAPPSGEWNAPPAPDPRPLYQTPGAR